MDVEAIIAATLAAIEGRRAPAGVDPRTARRVTRVIDAIRAAEPGAGG